MVNQLTENLISDLGKNMYSLSKMTCMSIGIAQPFGKYVNSILRIYFYARCQNCGIRGDHHMEQKIFTYKCDLSEKSQPIKCCLKLRLSNFCNLF